MKRKAKRVLQTRTINRKVQRQVNNGFGTSMPPRMEFVIIYFDQQGEANSADVFFYEHQNRFWKTLSGTPILNWKVCAVDWIFNLRQERKRKMRMSVFNDESI